MIKDKMSSLEPQPDLGKMDDFSVFYDFHILALFDRHTLSELAINMSLLKLCDLQ